MCGTGIAGTVTNYYVTKGDHIVMLTKVSQATPVVCDLELELKRTRSLATQHLSPSQQREREGDCVGGRAWKETSLHRDLEPFPRGPLASG